VSQQGVGAWQSPGGGCVGVGSWHSGGLGAWERGRVSGPLALAGSASTAVAADVCCWAASGAG
jgi:hypothetical protein